MIERAVILAQKTDLQVPIGNLKPSARSVTSAPVASAVVSEPPAAPADVQGEDTSLESIEREHIMRVLRETNWVVGGPEGAAARLGLKRTTLQARMKKLKIERHHTAP